MSIQRFANNQTFISNHHKPIKLSDRRKNLWRIEINALTSYLNISFVSRIEASFLKSKICFQRFITIQFWSFVSIIEVLFPESKLCFRYWSFFSGIESSFPNCCYKSDYNKLYFRLVILIPILIRFSIVITIRNWSFVSLLLFQFEFEASFPTYHTLPLQKVVSGLFLQFQFEASLEERELERHANSRGLVFIFSTTLRLVPI